ncbi:MAG TPA: hypothetical protein VK217_01680, partial [Acidimicrobiales bacterium]|nr:hypothetical protein [Acidimicrobiales bacterium]
ASFEDFLAESPGLLDKQLLARHYSAQTMWSETARRRWVAPDLTRLTCGTTLQSRLRPVRLPIARRI